MDNNTNRGVAGGISADSLLLLAFIVLKLCGVIGWSWPVVLLPTFIGAGLFIIAFVAVVFFNL